ncbi:hypothetical protein LA080_007356 [Diaporthe eres]|nr:hypothetical protein LA080_007356 [Diaporthe eres]
MIEAPTGRPQCYWMIELSDKVKCDASSRRPEAGKGATGQQICVSSASDGQDKAEYFGLGAAESIVVLAIRPARAGRFSWLGGGGPRTTAIVLGFWKCAKTAASEAAALGGPSAAWE